LKNVPSNLRVCACAEVLSNLIGSSESGCGDAYSEDLRSDGSSRFRDVSIMRYAKLTSHWNVPSKLLPTTDKSECKLFNFYYIIIISQFPNLANGMF
jgi:hypothetical protein